MAWVLLKAKTETTSSGQVVCLLAGHVDQEEEQGAKSRETGKEQEAMQEAVAMVVTFPTDRGSIPWRFLGSFLTCDSELSSQGEVGDSIYTWALIPYQSRGGVPHRAKPLKLHFWAAGA